MYVLDIRTVVGPAAADFPRDVCLTVSRNHKVFLLYTLSVLHNNDNLQGNTHYNKASTLRRYKQYHIAQHEYHVRR